MIQEICLVPSYLQLNLIDSSDLHSDLVLCLPLLLFQGWVGSEHFPKLKGRFGGSSNYPGELNGRSISLFHPQCLFVFACEALISNILFIKVQN